MRCLLPKCVGSMKRMTKYLMHIVRSHHTLRPLGRAGLRRSLEPECRPINPSARLCDELRDGETIRVVPRAASVAAPVIATRAQCARLSPHEEGDESVCDRQAKVPGFSQEVFSNLKVLLVGAGALGGEIAEGLVRKGVGRLAILDFDVVQPSNLARQFFTEADVLSNKAMCLVRNLQPHGYMGTEMIGWPLSFEDALEQDVDLTCGVVVSAVDDAETRAAISCFANENKIPAVFSAVSEQADHGVVFIQEVDGPCFGCAFPNQAQGGRTPCPGTPAIKDIMKVMGGIVLYAIDSLFMERPRRWTLYDLSLVDGNSSRCGNVERRPECPLCGGDA
jgi:molybdopterin/thiamine biosynthesis adenylyltransferase